MTDSDTKQGAKKVRSLPLLCVESICKFTPTSNLARLYSNDVPLPGTFWQFGLETVLRKRLPLSLGDDFPFHKEPDAPMQLWDAGGAKVAIVNQPEAFRFSPLRELIDRASLNLAYCPMDANQIDCRDRLSVAHAEAILSHLPDVTELIIAVQDISGNLAVKSLDLFEAPLKHLLPKLQSLRIHVTVPYNNYPSMRPARLALTDYMCDLALPEMVSLRRLDLPDYILDSILLRANAVNSTFSPSAMRALSGLTSLCVRREFICCENDQNRGPRSDMLRFVSSHLSHLSTLMIVVEGDLKLYLVAFRALSILRCLGLQLMREKREPYLTGVTFGEDEVVASVLDLRFLCFSFIFNELRPKVFDIASLFPSAKALAFQADWEHCEVLELAAECCTKRVLPAVEKLSCFLVPAGYCYSRSKHLADFIGSSNLPEAVDLSEMIFVELSCDPDLLSDVYRAMQISSAKSLLLRGPVHRETLSVLQSRIDVSGKKVHLKAWKDRDLTEQPRPWDFPQISQQMDIKIVGVKTGGTLKGQQFTIRVMHQLTKRRGIFDLVEEES